MDEKPKKPNSEVKPKRPPTAGSFSKDRPGPGRGHKKAVQALGLSVVEEMEIAYSSAEKASDPIGVKAARKLAHDDYPRFLATYLKFKELAGQAAEKPQLEDGVAAAVSADVGTKEQTIIELANRLLTEWENEDGKQGAEGREDGSGCVADGELHGR